MQLKMELLNTSSCYQSMHSRSLQECVTVYRGWEEGQRGMEEGGGREGGEGGKEGREGEKVGGCVQVYSICTLVWWCRYSSLE